MPKKRRAKKSLRSRELNPGGATNLNIRCTWDERELWQTHAGAIPISTFTRDVLTRLSHGWRLTPPPPDAR